MNPDEVTHDDAPEVDETPMTPAQYAASVERQIAIIDDEIQAGLEEVEQIRTEANEAIAATRSAIKLKREARRVWVRSRPRKPRTKKAPSDA